MNSKNALLSLDGLSVGDAFGENFFVLNPAERIESRLLPDGIWEWSDDTHMTLSIVEALIKQGCIDQDNLMSRFSTRYVKDRRFGYGAGARQLLTRTYAGGDWRAINQQIIKGGSYGNGAAMRVAPLGGFFAGDIERTAHEARLSAEVTHAHLEGIAGAVAVAVAAAIAASSPVPHGVEFLQRIVPFVPEGLTRAGILQAVDVPPETGIDLAVQILGNGANISAQDTVPYCLWCAAYHLDDYAEALRATVAGLGDRDTTCAIVGGIVALSARNIPEKWLSQREPLPLNFQNFTE